MAYPKLYLEFMDSYEEIYSKIKETKQFLNIPIEKSFYKSIQTVGYANLKDNKLEIVVRLNKTPKEMDNLPNNLPQNFKGAQIKYMNKIELNPLTPLH